MRSDPAGSRLDSNRRMQVLVWVVAAVLAVALPAAPVRAAASTPTPPPLLGSALADTVAAVVCDLDGDGRPDGEASELNSNGADTVAERVAGLVFGTTPSGRHLTPTAPTEQWAITVCRAPGDADPPVEWLDGSPEVNLRDASIAAEERLLANAAAWAENLAGPIPTTSPELTVRHTVGLDVWLAVSPDHFTAETWTGSAEGVTVTATATPVSALWLVDDVEIRCDGPGTPRPTGTPLGAKPPCGAVFERLGPADVSVSTVYSVERSSTLGRAAATTIDVTSRPTIQPVEVGEIQAWNIDSTRAEIDTPPEPVYGETLLEQHEREAAEEFCVELGDALGTTARWTPFGIGAQLIDLGADSLGVDLDLTGTVEDAAAGLARGGCELIDDIGVMARLLWDALRGCFSNLADAIDDARQLITQAAEFAADPVEFVTDLIGAASALTDAFLADPSAFVTDFAADAVADLVSLDTLHTDGPAYWAGRVGCHLARWAAGGGPQQLGTVALNARHWANATPDTRRTLTLDTERPGTNAGDRTNPDGTHPDGPQPDDPNGSDPDGAGSDSADARGHSEPHAACSTAAAAAATSTASTPGCGLARSEIDHDGNSIPAAVTNPTLAQAAAARAFGVDPRWVSSAGELRYPEQDGFTTRPGPDGPEPDTFAMTLPAGRIIDRYGEHATGTFFSPLGDSFGARALPASQAHTRHYVIEVIKPVPVRAGTVRPWFDQPGGGTQYHVDLAATGDLVTRDRSGNYDTTVWEEYFRVVDTTDLRTAPQ